MKLIRTLEDFNKSVTLTVTTESLRLEFKEKADGFSDRTPADVKRECQIDLVSDIAQFANTDGGTVLYGIEEGAGPTPNLKIAKAITGLQNPDGLKQWIEDAIGRYTSPRTFSREVNAITTPSGVVLAVSVPASRNLVAAWDPDRHFMKYPRRTSHGRDWMNPEDVERHIMNGSRAARIALTRAAEKASKDGYGASQVELIDGLRREMGHPHPHQRIGRPGPSLSAGSFGDDSFELKVVWNDRHWVTSLPYGLVKEAWLTTTQKVGLHLDVVIVVPHDQSTMLILERV